jgi:hypothetical protein
MSHSVACYLLTKLSGILGPTYMLSFGKGQLEDLASTSAEMLTRGGDTRASSITTTCSAQNVHTQLTTPHQCVQLCSCSNRPRTLKLSYSYPSSQIVSCKQTSLHITSVYKPTKVHRNLDTMMATLRWLRSGVIIPYYGINGSYACWIFKSEGPHSLFQTLRVNCLCFSIVQ